MFQNTLRILTKIQKPVVSKASIHHTTTKFEKWDLLTAVCLERKPIITPALNDIEKEYKEYLEAVEYEKSLKNDTELKLESEAKQLELLKKGADLDEEVSLKQTAQDIIDSCTEELAKFRPSDRVTEADKKNDVKSLQRKLDKHLVLVLKQKLGDKEYFLLPQGVRNDGETLRQAADRVLKQGCGPDLKAQIYGNAPMGFYKYKYPKEIRNSGEVVGAKVFIYFARHINGNLPQKGNDYKWLDRNELEAILPNKEYVKSVSQMLIDE